MNFTKIDADNWFSGKLQGGTILGNIFDDLAALQEDVEELLIKLLDGEITAQQAYDEVMGKVV